jgi:hypothetical protein
MDETDQITGFLPYASGHKEICARPWLGFPMPHPSWIGKVTWFRQYYYKDPAPYCCEDNETCVRIARKIGCDSWQTIASISENIDRYGGSALDDEKTRFRKGTLIRIPFDYDREKVASLVDRSSHKRKRA